MQLRRLALTGPMLAIALLVPAAGAQADSPAPFSGNATRPSSCAAGALPEDGVQGEVTTADRSSGRSELGYRCNLSLIGQSQGDGATWVDPTYGHCAYLAHSTVGSVAGGDPGVSVVDAADPARPVISDTLTSPSMLGDTWESLKVNQARGLLAGVSVPAYTGAVFFDIYDVRTDCAHPRLLDSVLGTALSIPANVMGHEGGWSPDGLTYWASGANAGSLTAIDVSDPAKPRVVWTGLTTVLDHGFDISPDGNRMYLSTTIPAGFVTLDISQIQARQALPAVTQISQAMFPDSTAPQHTIAITQQGHPWVIGVDEIGMAGIHFVDMADPTSPVVHSGITLQIEQPANAAAASSESSSDVAGLFGYSPHYCSVDRTVNPTALACGYFQAGIRVFDIRNLAHPREIAYFNPPGHTAAFPGLTGSSHSNSQGDLSVDWCTSPPSFEGDELWASCQDSGFLALRFAPGTYPITTPVGATTPSAVKHPTTRTTKHPVTVAAPQRSLAATGEPDWAMGLAVGLIGGAGLLTVAGRRRGERRMPAGSMAVVVVALAATFGSPVLRDGHPATPSADVAFAQDMIAHHSQAVAMARQAERDPRTSPIDRTFAQGIDVEQSAEITALRRMLRQWQIPLVAASIPPMTMGITSAMGPAAYNRHFLAAMLTHHQTALPIIAAALSGGSSPVKVIAQTMRIDQTLEMRWIQSSLH